MALVKKTPSKPPVDERRAGARDLAGLIEKLADPDAATRRWAARDLATQAGASDALLALVGAESDVSVREVALSSLTRIGDETAVNGLMSCLRSEEAGLRNEAIEAMKSLPREVAPMMRALLADPDPDVRIFSINVLESLRHPDVEDWLIGVISRDTELNVCGAAVDLLTEVGTGKARDALESLRARFAGEPYIQFAAGLALQRIESS
jgi:HEAT repeat protein